MKNEIPNSEDFEKALHIIFAYKTIIEDACFVEIQNGKLHKIVGGYPNGGNHRMPICCEVMRKIMMKEDEILDESESGESSKLLIRYKLPRNKK